MTTWNHAELLELGRKVRRWLLRGPDRLSALSDAIEECTGGPPTTRDVRLHHEDFDLAGLCGLAALTVARRVGDVGTMRHGRLDGRYHAWSEIDGRILDVTLRQFDREHPCVLVTPKRSAFGRRYRTDRRGIGALAHIVRFDYDAAPLELVRMGVDVHQLAAAAPLALGAILKVANITSRTASP